MADTADGIVLTVVVVFGEIGLIAVDDDDAIVGCCENALSCEFIESVGDCTGAGNADVGIVKGILRINFYQNFLLYFFFFFTFPTLYYFFFCSVCVSIFRIFFIVVCDTDPIKTFALE